jgi:hypothetical protein
MARGWESKSVEEQQAASAGEREARHDESAGDPEKQRKIANLRLARAQASHALEAAGNPRYREMLEQAIAELDSQLAKLSG